MLDHNRNDHFYADSERCDSGEESQDEPESTEELGRDRQEGERSRDVQQAGKEAHGGKIRSLRTSPTSSARRARKRQLPAPVSESPLWSRYPWHIVCESFFPLSSTKFGTQTSFSASMPPSIFFSFHPIANIWSTILKPHAIRFTAREKCHYVAIDQAYILQIENDVAVVCFEFKKSPQLGYRRCFDLATQDEHRESPSRRCLNPKGHQLGSKKKLEWTA